MLGEVCTRNILGDCSLIMIGGVGKLEGATFLGYYNRGVTFLGCHHREFTVLRVSILKARNDGGHFFRV